MPFRRQRLALRRKAMGFSQEQLAERLDIDRSTIGRWESSETVPQPWIRPRLARALQVSLDELAKLLDEGGLPDSEVEQRLDFALVHDITQRTTRAERLTIASPAHLQEILIHLREQWHALVKTDNLLGPRFALAGVLNQISVVEALHSILRGEQRIEVTRLGAKYAESAAWLYEDADNMTQARSWTSQAMEWAYEGNDERMLAWVIFRRAQQAAAIPDAAQTIGLAQAARRNEAKLATPTRAAIRVQEAYGHALDGNDQAAQRLLDEAIPGLRAILLAMPAKGTARTAHRAI
jgi:transcriptional regulator with XRE-family HTH domain